jgi:hypothetical protein
LLEEFDHTDAAHGRRAAIVACVSGLFRHFGHI